MKKALLFSTAFLLASASLCLAAEERSVSGVIKSIDRQARTITLEDHVPYPLHANADTAWLQPGNNVELLCDYDAEVVLGCGIAISSLPEETHAVTPAQPRLGADLGVEEKTVDGLPENVLPDEPTYRLDDLLRSLGEK
jgi:hypothetical protein